MPVQAKRFGFGMPWESLYGYSQAIQAGDVVYVSGQVSHDRDGNFVGAMTSSSRSRPRWPIWTWC